MQRLAWEEKSSKGSEIVRRINQNHIHLWDMGTGSFLSFCGRQLHFGMPFLTSVLLPLRIAMTDFVPSIRILSFLRIATRQ